MEKEERSIPLEEGNEEEEFKHWQTGYRSWKLGFKGEEPRLFPFHWGDEPWEPGEEGEVLSDYEEERNGAFEKTSKGLYSLRSPKELRESGYEKGEIVGAITPYGEVVHGERGFRSSKAKVQALFRKKIPCYICGKSSSVIVKEGERVLIPLCKTCRKRLDRLISKIKYEEYTLEELLDKLASIYDTECVDYPD